MGKALLEMQEGVGGNPSSPGGHLIMRGDHSEMGRLQLVTWQRPQGSEPSPLRTREGLVLTAPTKAELAEEGCSHTSSLSYPSSGRVLARPAA